MALSYCVACGANNLKVPYAAQNRARTFTKMDTQHIICTVCYQDSSHSSTETRFRSQKLESEPGQFKFLEANVSFEASESNVSHYREHTGS